MTDADGFEHSNSVSINVNNLLVLPSANAGLDQNVVARRTITLDGSKSANPSGTISIVQWEQISGKNQGTLTAPKELTTEFTAPAVETEGECPSRNNTFRPPAKTAAILQPQASWTLR